MNLGGLREGKDLEAGNESVAAPLLGLRVPTTNDRPAVDPKFVGSRSQQNMALDSNYTSTARQKGLQIRAASSRSNFVLHRISIGFKVGT